jgi:hypothetical protein
MLRIHKKLKGARRLFRRANRLDLEIEELKILHGRLLGSLGREKTSSCLKDYEFKVFSQWGEDGIIQKLVSCLDIPVRTFIEFGVEDFSESNCRFLMMNDLWRGHVIDGSSENINAIESSRYFWRYQLNARAAFISRENINELLEQSGFPHDLGLLSVDLDGVDYWVVDAIRNYNPRILILEYNAIFGNGRPITVPYDKSFFRTRAHYSNLYFGASLSALTLLANRRGYALVGTNSAGCNAFFVRSELLQETPFRALSAEAAYTESVARESRNPDGKLSYLGGAQRYELIRGLPVVNVATNEIEKL